MPMASPAFFDFDSFKINSPMLGPSTSAAIPIFDSRTKQEQLLLRVVFIIRRESYGT
jgi:hypothetical protein